MVKIFTVYDSKIKAYMDPFTSQHTGQAIRSWTETVNDPKTPFNKYPEDFTLFEVGTFDTNTGRLVPLEALHSLGTALSVREEPVSATPLFDRKGKAN